MANNSFADHFQRAVQKHASSTPTQLNDHASQNLLDGLREATQEQIKATATELAQTISWMIVNNLKRRESTEFVMPQDDPFDDTSAFESTYKDARSALVEKIIQLIRDKTSNQNYVPNESQAEYTKALIQKSWREEMNAVVKQIQREYGMLESLQLSATGHDPVEGQSTVTFMVSKPKPLSSTQESKPEHNGNQ